MTKTPQAKCAEKLQKIAPHISASDRKEAMAKFNLSYITISRYLSGKVAVITTGLNLLEFFLNAIKERKKRLDEL